MTNNQFLPLPYLPNIQLNACFRHPDAQQYIKPFLKNLVFEFFRKSDLKLIFEAFGQILNSYSIKTQLSVEKISSYFIIWRPNKCSFLRTKMKFVNIIITF